MRAKSSISGAPATKPSRRDQRAAKALEELRLLPVIVAAKPLRTGIEREIGEAFPALSAETIDAFLEAHVAGVAYLKNLAAGRARYNLANEPRGWISTSQRAYAVKLLEAGPKA